MAVRRVRRVIRKIDPWTVLKVSLVFDAIASLLFVLGTWVMWSILVQRGIPERLSELAANLTLTFTPDGALYFRIVVLVAVISTILFSGSVTLAAVLYNLISDVVGGIEVIVLEERFDLPAAVPTRVRPAVHRAVANGTGAGTEPAVPATGPLPTAVGD